MNKKNLLFLFFALFIGSNASAQLSIGDIKKEANNYVKNKQYFKAIKLYERIAQIKPSEKLDLFKVGLSYYQTNQLSKASKNFILLLNRENKPDPLAYLYLANIHHQESDYDRAIVFYKKFLNKTGTKHKMSDYAVDQIKRCAEGRNLSFKEQKAYAENMGATLNSIYDEIAPMPSPNFNNKIYFSSVREGNTGGPRNKQGERDPLYGNYLSDMFTADLSQGVWSNPRPINPELNTSKGEFLLGFRERGQLVYFLRSDIKGDQLYVDTFVQQMDSIYMPHTGKWPVQFGINKMGSLHFYNDTTMLFSSRSLGGEGGYDIFISKYRDGRWTTPINLGPEVNTAYDEVSPFLTMDGRGLYFSSNRLTSIGGYDIFKTKYNDRNNRWQKIENINAPINSASDDLYFRIDTDGSRAWFSSARSDGFGGLDLYSCFFRQKVPEHLTTSSPLTFDMLNRRDPSDLVTTIGESSGIPTEVTQPIFSEDEIRDFEVSPLYYEENDFILSPANVKIIDRYASLLKSYPALQIQLTAHADNRDPKEFDQYFSIKRAEKLASVMISKGIPSSRIIVRGCGSQYPVAQNVIDGVPYRTGQAFNRRIDIQIVNGENMPIHIKYKEPIISERIGLPLGYNYKNKNNGLTYRVKIVSTSQPYTQLSFLNAEHPAVEKYMNANTYNYVVGIYSNYNMAKSKKAEAMGKGLQSAQIIPYIDGHPVSRALLQFKSDEYSDLNYYLEEN